MDEKTVNTLAEQIGFEHFGKLDLSALVFRKEVRRMCSRDRCERFGRKRGVFWAPCGPAKKPF